MSLRFSPTRVAVVLLLLTSTTFAQDEKEVETVDPSGTWRWEHQDPGSGETVKDVLRVNLGKDGKVVGTYQGNSEPIEIENGKIDGDRLTFQFDVAFSETITIKFDGKIKKDDIEGEVAFEAAGNSGSFPWTAKRGVELSDLVGTWEFEIVTPNGDTLTPTMTVEKPKDDKTPPKVSWKTTTGLEMEVKTLEVKNNHAIFRIVGEFEGTSITVDFKGRPYGDKMKGTLEYDFDGNIGEGDFACKRKPEKKENTEKEQKDEQ